MTVCHLFPGVSPVTVWDLDAGAWEQMALEVDRWLEAQRRERVALERMRRGRMAGRR